MVVGIYIGIILIIIAVVSLLVKFTDPKKVKRRNR